MTFCSGLRIAPGRITGTTTILTSGPTIIESAVSNLLSDSADLLAAFPDIRKPKKDFDFKGELGFELRGQDSIVLTSELNASACVPGRREGEGAEAGDAGRQAACRSGTPTRCARRHRRKADRIPAIRWSIDRLQVLQPHPHGGRARTRGRPTLIFTKPEVKREQADRHGILSGSDLLGRDPG